MGENSTMENIPNASMSMLMYSPVFGNMALQVMAPSKGVKARGFPVVSSPSLEALLYNGQMSNPLVAPSNLQTGSTAGTQNVQGGITTTDTSGNIRVAIGSGSF